LLNLFAVFVVVIYCLNGLIIIKEKQEQKVKPINPFKCIKYEEKKMEKNKNNELRIDIFLQFENQKETK